METSDLVTITHNAPEITGRWGEENIPTVHVYSKIPEDKQPHTLKSNAEGISYSIINQIRTGGGCRNVNMGPEFMEWIQQIENRTGENLGRIYSNIQEAYNGRRILTQSLINQILQSGFIDIENPKTEYKFNDLTIDESTYLRYIGKRAQLIEAKKIEDNNPGYYLDTIFKDALVTHQLCNFFKGEGKGKSAKDFEFSMESLFVEGDELTPRFDRFVSEAASRTYENYLTKNQLQNNEVHWQKHLLNMTIKYRNIVTDNGSLNGREFVNYYLPSQHNNNVGEFGIQEILKQAIVKSRKNTTES